jgi:hypothetical protein
VESSLPAGSSLNFSHCDGEPEARLVVDCILGAHRHIADRLCLPLLAVEQVEPAGNRVWYNNADMETPVREHIRKLEERLRTLNMNVMENSRSLAERNQIEAEIRAANLALAHYRAALKLEKQIFTG